MKKTDSNSQLCALISTFKQSINRILRRIMRVRSYYVLFPSNNIKIIEVKIYKGPHLHRANPNLLATKSRYACCKLRLVYKLYTVLDLFKRPVGSGLGRIIAG
jgi:hypothetical protein